MNRIGENFSVAAKVYDDHAIFQQEETRRVYDAASVQFPPHSRILDIGCGTGHFAALAKAHYPLWNVTGLDLAYGMCEVAAERCPVVQADATRLPFASDSFDGIVSSLCLQWVQNIPAAFCEIARVLRPGGQAVLASLGGGTLRELRRLGQQVGLPLRLLPMREGDAYHAAITQQQLEIVSFAQDVQVRYYPGVLALLESMRRIGAGGNFGEPARGLTGATRWKQLLDSYNKLRTDKGIPASWEQILMIVRKP